MTRQAFEYWLNSIPGIGAKTIAKLLASCGSAEAVYRSKAGALKGILTAKQMEALAERQKSRDVRAEYEKLLQKGIRFFSLSSEEYPERLRRIPDPPYGVFLKGRLPEDDVLSVAVIGARECSEYGSFVARALGRAFAEAGIWVVSGMARGIDGISQQAALEAGGKSLGILGCGVDICYPEQNRALYEQLIRKGGVLSSYPPGSRPAAALFPPRNRLVSGLADAVIVVEARQKSGTLITVDMALEQGREVYVVPGRLTDRLSDGCNRLLKQGAGILLSPQDFLGELYALFPEKRALRQNGERTGPEGDGTGTGRSRAAAEKDSTDKALTDRAAADKAGTEEAIVLSCLDFYPRSVEQLRQALPEPMEYGRLQRILMKLCIQGKAKQDGVGYFCKGEP